MSIKSVLLYIYFINPVFFTNLAHSLYKKKQFIFIPAHDYKDANKFKHRVCLESYVEVKGPVIVGIYPIKIITKSLVNVLNPAIEVRVFDDVSVIGGTFLIYDDKCCIYPDVYNPSRDLMPLEVHQLGELNEDYSKITLKVTTNNLNIQAISLVGQCTGNYAHWITETLTKLMIINQIPDFDGVPLLVDEWIHPNFYRSIEFFTDRNREIIFVPRWKSLRVRKLIDVSSPCYIPYEKRRGENEHTDNAVNHEYFIYSKQVLNSFRNYKYGSCEEPLRKVYLQRGRNTVGNGRLIVNIEEVEDVIRQNGYEFIDPGVMTFDQQVECFQNVKSVISPIGASLTNLVFSPVGCDVIVLSPYYEGANYYFFSSLLSILGHEVKFVLGPQEKYKSGHFFHQNYFVNVDYLKQAINSK